MPWAVSDEAGTGRTRLGRVSRSVEVAERNPLWCRDASYRGLHASVECRAGNAWSSDKRSSNKCCTLHARNSMNSWQPLTYVQCLKNLQELSVTPGPTISAIRTADNK